MDSRFEDSRNDSRDLEREIDKEKGREIDNSQKSLGLIAAKFDAEAEAKRI